MIVMEIFLWLLNERLFDETQKILWTSKNSQI